MKKMLLTAAVVLCTCLAFAGPTSDVSEKVLQAFARTFTNVNQVVWHEYADSYEVRFMQGAVDSRVKYDKDGNILESRRYYGENDLPLLIKAKVHKNYPDKKIYGVTEISSSESTQYYIILEDEKNWYNIESDAYGNMATQNKYKKA